MKYIDEYRSRELVLSVAEKLKTASNKEITLMEVCGGHTMAVNRFGLRSLIPPNIRLISGPGCPVCVSGREFIDRLIACSTIPGTIIATYGDLVRVPGSWASLGRARAEGSDIRVIYSALEAIEIAVMNPGRKVIFPGIGFETTAPATAAAVIRAAEKNIRNFFVMSAHKIMPPVMKSLAEEDLNINGFMAPGHVTTITGAGIYDELLSACRTGVVVAGFEPADIMQSVLMLVRQIESGDPKVEIQYSRAVNREGNTRARQIMNEVFETRDDMWRGIGIIRGSGLGLKNGFSAFDAEKAFRIEIPSAPEPEGCICGDILRGFKHPADCRLYGNGCTPESPVGACMVSQEGTCAAYYRYRR